MGDKRNYAALDWVLGEIGETLKDARQALEAYVEDPRDTARIRFCLTHIHQVHGSLQMVEFHGASLFAEEMELLTAAIMHNKVSNEKEAQEVLMRSLLQLPLYLEQVKANHDDHPAIVMPLLNDLRAVRKQPYLSETNLFHPDLSSVGRVIGQRHSSLEDIPRLKPVLKKLQDMYQFAAASVLRGLKIDENLGYIDKVFTRLETITRGTLCHPTWYAAAALTEALIRDDVELSVAVRGLLRNLAREIKVLNEHCPAAFDASPPEPLLRNLLYYVGLARSGGARVAAVKQRFQLEQSSVLPGGHGGAQNMLSAPEPEAVRAVVAALQEELNSAKFLMDRALSGQGSMSEVEETLPFIKRISDTLAVLGIADMRKHTLEQHNALVQMCKTGTISDSVLIDVAGRLADLENRLEAIGKGKASDYTRVDERAVEIDTAKQAVLNECRNGMDVVKEAIIESMSAKWDPSFLPKAVETLSDIRGGFNMVPLPRPAAILEACGQFIQRELVDRDTNPGDALQTLAEAIASVDYYLERLIGGHGDDLDGYLEMAEESLTELGYRPKGADNYVRQADTAAELGERPDESRFDDTVRASDNADVQDFIRNYAHTSEDDEAGEQEVAESFDAISDQGQEGTEVAVEVAEADAVAVTGDAEESDTDVVSAPETFASQDTGEAEHYMGLAGQPAEEETVGESSAGETQEAGEPEETAASEEPAAEEDLADLEASAPMVETLAEEEEESEIDEEIIEIFVEEAAEVQETLAEYFPRWSNNLDDNNSLVTVRRSFHTLKGSGRMVEAMEVGELAWSIENMLNRIMDHSIQPQSAHIDLIEKVLVVIPDLITAFKERRPNPHKALTDKYIDWAGRLAKGDVPAEMAGFVEQSIVKPDEVEEDNEDQILWDIFASEATTHLDVVRGFIASMDEQSPLYDVPSDDLQRALHTLKGSAHMAAVTPIAAMIAPLENFVKELRIYQVRVDDDILQLIRDSVQYTQEGLECIGRGEPVELPKLDQFIARVRELRDDHVAPLIHLRDHEREGEKPVDPRLLAIFMAEEMNLLLDAHKIMADWADEPAAPHPAIERLIEELRTLSEGASQANLPAMATLSHQLKKLHAAALENRLDTDEHFFATVNPAHDTLLDMVDAVAAGQNVPAVDAYLQARLEGLLAPISDDEVQSTEVSEAAVDVSGEETAPSWSEEADMEAVDLGEASLPAGDAVGDEVPHEGERIYEEVAYDFGDASAFSADQTDTVNSEGSDQPADEETFASAAAWDSGAGTFNEDESYVDLTLDADELPPEVQTPSVEQQAEEQTAEEDTEQAEFGVESFDADYEQDDYEADAAPLLSESADSVSWEVGADEAAASDEQPVYGLTPETPDDLPLTTEIAEDAPELAEFAFSEAGDERLFLGDPEETLSRLEEEALEEDGELAGDTVSDEASVLQGWEEATGGDEEEVTLEGVADAVLLMDVADDDVIEIEIPFEDDQAGLLTDVALHEVDELHLEDEQGATEEPVVEITVGDALLVEEEPLAEDEIYIDAHPEVEAEQPAHEDDVEFDLAQLESDLLASEATGSMAVEDLDNVHRDDHAESYAHGEPPEMDDADLTEEELEEARRLEDINEVEALRDNDFASSAADMHAEKHEAGPALSPWQLGSPEQLASIETDDYDQDILEIFLEEANELIEELDEAIHLWESEPNAEEPADTMKRVLHTLKGGARLSGLMNLGELTHNYESFLIATRHPSDNEAFFPLVHQYQDLLLNGVKAVRARLDGRSAAEAPVEADTPDAPAVTAKPGGLREAPTEGQVLPFIPRPATPRPEFVPFPEPSETAQEAPAAPARTGSQEMVKVSADLLEELVNLAGETTISRGRLEQQVSDLTSAVDEIETTLGRLSEQLRRLDMETEAQVLFRQERMASYEEFDPLEMDRYSQLQQLTRSLMESASDLVDLKRTLGDKLRDTETLLLQQSRITSSLQEGLMRSRMVPFSRLVPRLRRIVRQVAAELGKQVNVEFDNVEGEMDRSVLERMVAPLEHMLRNAVDHGIEKPDERVAAGKPPTGRVLVSLAREGGDILLRLADDGRGVNIKRVREKAIERGLMAEDSNLSDYDVMQFILQAGFSTAENVTHISGRGVGMDVVASEIKQLGGSVGIDSRPGVGTQFIVRLPFTVSVNRALMVQLGGETFAIALNSIEGIVRVSPFELEHYYTQPDAFFEYAGDSYQVRHLNSLVTPGFLPRLEGQILPLPVILVRSAQHTMALQVDGLMGSKEIVVKSLGPQFASVQGLSGATVMGDGSVVVILDVHALVRREVAMLGSGQRTLGIATQPEQAPQKVAKTIMVVDDSVTVRKVTTRFLEREGYHVITAKDGVDALQVLQENVPDLMLLDIEMPRMDGFEVARNVRSSSRWKQIPIIMITSRTGDKHRQHALSLGVNEYLGKPYQEDVLSKLITSLLAKQTKTA